MKTRPRGASYTYMMGVVAVATDVMHGPFQTCCRAKEWKFGGKVAWKAGRALRAAVSVNGADLK